MRRALAWALLLGWLFAALTGDAHADSKRRVLVLGPRGKPLDRVLVTYVRERFDERPVLDVLARGEEVLLRRGVLESLDPWPGDVILWRPELAPVAVGKEDALTGVRLLTGLPLPGRIRFAAGAKPGGRALLAVPTSPGGVVHRCETAKDGTFLFPRLAPGAWRILVQRGDGRLQDIGDFDAGQKADARITSGGQVAGALLDGEASERTPLPGRRLRFHLLPGGASPPGSGPEVVTDAAGGFALADLPAGVWEARTVDPDLVLEPATPRFEVRARRTVEIRPFFAIRKVAVEGTVQGVDDQPVAGARLELWLAPDERPPLEGLKIPPAIVTDAEGRYRFEGVRPGLRWRVAARARGFAYRLSAPFAVARGKPTEVLPIVLTRGWRLEARIWRSGGVPAAGVQVRAVPAARPDAVGKETDGAEVRASSNADGIAILEDLPAEDIRVVAGGGPWLLIEDVVPWPRTGDARVWNGILAPAPTLEGRVVMEGGGRLPPIALWAHPRDASEPRPIELRPGGRFVSGGLAAVPTDIHVVLEARPGDRPLVVYEGAIPGDGRDLRIQVPVLRAVRGRALRLDPEGGPAEVRLEAPVVDLEEDVHRWRTVRRLGLTLGRRDADFLFEDVGPGPHAVRVVQGHLDSGPIALWVDGADVGGIEVSMPAGGGVAGVVLEGSSRPRLGALVTLTRLRADGDAPEGGDAGWTKATTADGGFAFEGLAPGLWRAVATFERSAPDAVLVRVGEGETVVVRDLHVGRGGALHGRLLDPNGRALDGVRLGLEALEEGIPRAEIRTRPDGRFAGEDLRPGLWRVKLLSAAGAFTDLEALVEIVADEDTEVVLTPHGRATLEGRVQRRGQDVANATVRLVALTPDEIEPLRRLETRTDPRGQFAWDHLPAGLYQVDVVDGVVRASRVVRLEDTDRLSLDLEVWGGRFGGIVRSVSGRGVAGAMVEALPRSIDGTTIASASVRTDPEGRFVFAGLPPGLYDLAASAPGLPPGRMKGVEAKESSADEDLELILGRGGTIEILALGPTGRGVSGTQVWIETAEGEPLHRRPFAVSWSGRLRIEGVPTGERWLRVEAAGFGRPARRKVVVEEGETTEHRFVLGPASRLLVLVRSADADPVPRARIDLRREASEIPLVFREHLFPVRLTPRLGRLPRTGRLEIGDLAPGAYELHVDAGRRFERQTLPIVIEEGEDSVVEVELVLREED